MVKKDIFKANNMLQETEITVKSTNNTSSEQNFFEDKTSLEEADCYLSFLTQPYPGTNKGTYIMYYFSCITKLCQTVAQNYEN